MSVQCVLHLGLAHKRTLSPTPLVLAQSRTQRNQVPLVTVVVGVGRSLAKGLEHTAPPREGQVLVHLTLALLVHMCSNLSTQRVTRSIERIPLVLVLVPHLIEFLHRLLEPLVFLFPPCEYVEIALEILQNGFGIPEIGTPIRHHYFFGIWIDEHLALPVGQGLVQLESFR